MWRFGLVIALALVGGVWPARAQGDETFTLMQGDDARGYVLHVPPAYDGAQAAPLVIALHGAGMSGAAMMLQTGLNEQADARGTIVAYPDGVGGYWNPFDAEEFPPDVEYPYYDDVQFIRDLIDHLSAEYNIDPRRVYLVGYSNGGMLALRLRCELGARIAGTALVGASVSLSLAQHCTGAEPASLLLALGTQDSAFPWMGYAAPQDDGSLDLTFSIAQAMTFLPLLNGCGLNAEAVEVTTPDRQHTIYRDTYTACEDNTRVVLYSLVNVAHEWPGYYPVMLDNGTQGTLADAIWQFFEQTRGSSGDGT